MREREKRMGSDDRSYDGTVRIRKETGKPGEW